jgi:dienelactone hydrolase
VKNTVGSEAHIRCEIFLIRFAIPLNLVFIWLNAKKMIRKLVLVTSLLATYSGGSAATCDYTVEKVAYKNLVAKAYLPKGERAAPMVIAFGGSEGGISTGESSGEMLAPHCIAVLALAYFKEGALPPTLDHIPLEYFVDAVDYAAQLGGVDKTRLGVLSGSRGSEAALLVASLDARIKSVVVTTPSEVPWYGRTQARSAWTYQGKDVPALSLEDSPLVPQAKRFENALDAVVSPDSYRIKVEHINGPIFLISAQNDEIWPSTRMSNAIVEQLKKHHFKYRIRHDIYPTGHGFSKETAVPIKKSVVEQFMDTL